MRERLKRVESFAELREGMIVIFKGCERGCGGSHRAMLTSFSARTYRMGAGIVEDNPTFELIPTPGCVQRIALLDAWDVKSGKIFRVVDGAEQSHRARRKKTEAA